ncbi:MAG: hypothetical protein KBT27_04945 [Prevotellaceae bacterium]|nr:hypothetical protein [Candidatus Faecinaster equi]
MPKLEYFGVCLWADMAVPIFLLIQTFHVFKKEPESVKFPNFIKLLRRIIFPFILIQAIAIAIRCFGKGDVDSVQIVKSFIAAGGFGPGSYYPWIYLQMAIALPLVVKIMSRCNALRINSLRRWGGYFLLYVFFKN